MNGEQNVQVSDTRGDDQKIKSWAHKKFQETKDKKQKNQKYKIEQIVNLKSELVNRKSQIKSFYVSIFRFADIKEKELKYKSSKPIQPSTQRRQRVAGIRV